MKNVFQFQTILNEDIFLNELSNILFLLQSPLKGYLFNNEDYCHIAKGTFVYFNNLENKLGIKIIQKPRNPYLDLYSVGINGIFSFDKLEKELKSINFNTDDYINEIKKYKHNILDFDVNDIDMVKCVAYFTLSLISMYYQKYLVFWKLY